MLRFGARTFKPGWAVSILAALGLIIFIAMGNWQVRRGDEKLALQHKLDERSRGPVIQVPPRPMALIDVEYARVSARGIFLPQHTILLDNRVSNGVSGYHVLTPLRIEGGELCVLVNRGWVAANPDRSKLPLLTTPDSPQTIEGIAVPPGRFFEFANATPSGPVWQNVTIERYAAATGLALQPFLLLQSSASDDGLRHVEEHPDAGVNTHRGYAFQWYAFASLVVFLYFALNFKRTQNADNEKSSGP